MAKVRIINGKGDWTDTPPTGADDHDLQTFVNDWIAQAGVLRPETGAALVEESDTPGMSVQVAAGIIYVENASWTESSDEPRYYVVTRPDAETGITIASNPAGSTRIDLICQKIDKVTTPNDDADNVCPIVVVQGIAGSGAPAVPDNHTVLAQVTVASGETSITNSEITDVREPVFAYPSLTNTGMLEVADAATMTFNCENGKYNKFYCEITANRTFVFSNVPTGFIFAIWVQQGSGGNKVPVLPTHISDFGDTIDFATVAGEIDCLVVTKLPSGDYSIVRAASAQS